MGNSPPWFMAVRGAIAHMTNIKYYLLWPESVHYRRFLITTSKIRRVIRVIGTRRGNRARNPNFGECKNSFRLGELKIEDWFKLACI